MDERLRPTERLHTAQEFRRVFERGACFRTPVLRIHYLRAAGTCSRMGLVVTRRIGKAVVRNRVKRLLREVFRRNKSLLPAPLDVVLVPQGGPKSHAEYVAAYARFAERARGGERTVKA